MAIDTPARIAVLGAGPIGLEAALYARYLGYAVDLFDRGEVAAHVRKWGHVQMYTPFGENCSPLGLAALKAQDPAWRPPDDDALLTGRQFAEQYLIPLAKSDLLVDGLHENSEIVAISRAGWPKGQGEGLDERADSDFRVLIRSPGANGHAQERIETYEAVLDATGTYGVHNWLGADGLPALGEIAAEPHIEYGLPDVLSEQRDRYASRNILLVGDGDLAASTLVALSELAAHSPDTWVTWVTSSLPESSRTRLPQQERIWQSALRLAADEGNHITHLPQTSVEALHWRAALDRFIVRLRGKQADELEFDRVIANVGYRGDNRLHEELQVEHLGTTGGPRPGGPNNVGTTEPDFYVLGAKNRGRDEAFRIAEGLDQIRRVFAVIGDRADLDLYRSVARLA